MSSKMNTKNIFCIIDTEKNTPLLNKDIYFTVFDGNHPFISTSKHCSETIKKKGNPNYKLGSIKFRVIENGKAID